MHVGRPLYLLSSHWAALLKNGSPACPMLCALAGVLRYLLGVWGQLKPSLSCVLAQASFSFWIQGSYLLPYLTLSGPQSLRLATRDCLCTCGPCMCSYGLSVVLTHDLNSERHMNECSLLEPCSSVSRTHEDFLFPRRNTGQAHRKLLGVQYGNFGSSGIEHG